MKKIILFILLLADIPFLTETHASTKQQARDSIFQTAATIPNDSIRCIFLRNAFQQYIGQESATEYLDSAIVPAGSKYTEKSYGHFLTIAANMNILQIFSISKKGF